MLGSRPINGLCALPWLVLACFAVAAGCGSSDDTGSNTANGGSGGSDAATGGSGGSDAATGGSGGSDAATGGSGGADAADEATSEASADADAATTRSLKVRVVTPMSLYNHPHDKSKWVAQTEAKVIVNVGEAGEVERAVDADGIAEFPEVNPDADTYSVLSYAAGCTVQLYMGLNAANRIKLHNPALLDTSVDMVLNLPPTNTAAIGIKVSGSITGKQAASDTVWVNASIRGTASEGTGNSYSLTTWADGAFKLDVFELGPAVADGTGTDRPLVNAWRFDIPAATGPVTFDIDLANSTPLPTTHITGTIVVPGGASGVFAGAAPGWWFNNQIASGTDNLGAWTRFEPLSDGSGFTVEADITVPPAEAKPGVSVMLKLTDGSYSQKAFAGIPSDGAEWSDFADPMATTIISQGLHEPIQVIGADLSADLLKLSLSLSSGAKVLFMRAPVDSAAVTVPNLPQSVMAILGTGTLTATMGTCTAPALESAYCSATQQTRSFSLTQ